MIKLLSRLAFLLLFLSGASQSSELSDFKRVMSNSQYFSKAQWEVKGKSNYGYDLKDFFEVHVKVGPQRINPLLVHKSGGVAIQLAKNQIGWFDSLLSHFSISRSSDRSLSDKIEALNEQRRVSKNSSIPHLVLHEKLKQEELKTFYFVSNGLSPLLISEDGHTTLIGNVKYIKDQQYDMSAKQHEYLKSAAIEQLTDAEMIIFPAKNKAVATIYISAPLSGQHCKKIAQDIPLYQLANIKVRFIPLASANAKANLFCSDNKKQQLLSKLADSQYQVVGSSTANCPSKFNVLDTLKDSMTASYHIKVEGDNKLHGMGHNTLFKVAMKSLVDNKIISKADAELSLSKAVEQKLQVKNKVLKLFQMVDIPKGRFQMGCVSDIDCHISQEPVHRVNLTRFKMMRNEVTFSLWDACVADGGCAHDPSDGSWGRNNRPVIYVNFEDITLQFIPWLNQLTGQTYSLPSESQWEYAARAGSKTQYSFGDSITCQQARLTDSKRCKDEQGPVPVKSYSSNNFGLYDMHGNVAEWTNDCANRYYKNAPNNGSSWNDGDCSKRMVRGGSWYLLRWGARSASRVEFSKLTRINSVGFRLVLNN